MFCSAHARSRRAHARSRLSVSRSATRALYCARARRHDATQSTRWMRSRCIGASLFEPIDFAAQPINLNLQRRNILISGSEFGGEFGVAFLAGALALAGEHFPDGACDGVALDVEMRFEPPFPSCGVRVALRGVMQRVAGVVAVEDDGRLRFSHGRASYWLHRFGSAQIVVGHGRPGVEARPLGKVLALALALGDALAAFVGCGL